jgi:MSHA pilin protein MshA
MEMNFSLNPTPPEPIFLTQAITPSGADRPLLKQFFQGSRPMQRTSSRLGSARYRGFTLIELVMVVVILAVLAVTALPKFIDIKSDAQAAATEGVASALSSAAAVNYAARKANSSKGSAVATCADGAALLQGGALPTGYTFAAGTTAVAADATVGCVINGPSSTTATAQIIGI